MFIKRQTFRWMCIVIAIVETSNDFDYRILFGSGIIWSFLRLVAMEGNCYLFNVIALKKNWNQKYNDIFNSLFLCIFNTRFGDLMMFLCTSSLNSTIYPKQKILLKKGGCFAFPIQFDHFLPPFGLFYSKNI